MTTVKEMRLLKGSTHLYSMATRIIMMQKKKAIVSIFKSSAAALRESTAAVKAHKSN